MSAYRIRRDVVEVVSSTPAAYTVQLSDGGIHTIAAALFEAIFEPALPAVVVSTSTDTPSPHIERGNRG